MPESDGLTVSEARTGPAYEISQKCVVNEYGNGRRTLVYKFQGDTVWCMKCTIISREAMFLS